MSTEIGPEPVYDDNLNCIIIVDGLPTVDAGKSAKLIGYVVKKFAEHGTVVENELPVDESGSSRGYMFIRFETVAQAKAAMIALNGKPMDRQHTYRITPFTDYEKYADVPETYNAPDPKDVKKPVPPLNAWLLDENLRDQFALRYMAETHETGIFFNDPLRKVDSQGRELVYDGSRETARGQIWCEMGIQFSPSGHYMVTFHGPGIALWGGKDFERISKFAHSNVTKAAFSPCERFLTTLAETHHRGGEVTCDAILWNVHSGQVVKKFAKVDAAEWPLVNFSPDGKFLTHIRPTGIAIIDAATMKVIDDKLLPAPNARHVSWCPTKNFLAFFVPGSSNLPDRICLYDADKKQMLREKHIFNVIDCKLFWQAKGDVLYAQTSVKKSKKSNVHSICLMRVAQKDVPIEDVPLPYEPIAMAVDPIHGHVAITTAVPMAHNANVSMCEVTVFKLNFKALKQVYNVSMPIPGNSKADCFKLDWSPTGNILAFGPATNDKLTFNILTVAKTPTLIAGDLEHDKGNLLSWDPSGRYIATAITRPFKVDRDGWNQAWRDNVDDSYKVWSFQGDLLATVSVPKLFQFLWRPRPATTLTTEEIAKVKADLPKVYWAKFDQEDDALTKNKKSEAARKRMAVKNSWKQFRQRCLEAYAEDMPWLIENGITVPESDYVEMIEYEDQVVSVKEVPIVAPVIASIDEEEEDQE